MVGSIEIKEVKECIYLEWMPKHGCGNFMEKKMKVEGICHNKRYVQGKAGKTICQFLQKAIFCLGC